MNNELRHYKDALTNFKSWRKSFNTFKAIKFTFQQHFSPILYLRDIKWLWQRAQRGYADCDVWSLDSYLALVITNSVEQLKNTGHSYPCNLEDPYGVVYYGYDSEFNYTVPEQERVQIWKQELEKISSAFKLYLELTEDIRFPLNGTSEEIRAHFEEQEQKAKNNKQNMHLLIHHFGSLWD